MEGHNSKTSKIAERFLRKKGIELIFNEKVISGENKVFKTDLKNELKADLVFFCTGITPNSRFLKNKLELLNEKRFISVNNFLQLSERDNIFVVGDVNNIKIEKTAQNARKQAKLTVRNIKRMEEGKNLIPYSKRKTIMVISLGKYNGIVEIRRHSFSGFFAGILKSLIQKQIMLAFKWKFLQRFA